jgi:predicted transglutaminase-like cysteine proteinase
MAITAGVQDRRQAASGLAAWVLGLAVGIAAAAMPVQAQAQPVVTAAETMGESTAPAGWLQFCAENPADCRVASLPSQLAPLDEKRWAELRRINREVNREIEPITDLDQWGMPERWNYPTTGRGDCEDYVLEKRRRLMAAGWPRQALLVTVVRDKKGEGHAVLTVRTTRGDFVLDNQEAQVLPWTETGYRFHKRQAEEHPNRWVSLGAVDTRPLMARR